MEEHLVSSAFSNLTATSQLLSISYRRVRTFALSRAGNLRRISWMLSYSCRSQQSKVDSWLKKRSCPQVDMSCLERNCLVSSFPDILVNIQINTPPNSQREFERKPHTTPTHKPNQSSQPAPTSPNNPSALPCCTNSPPALADPDQLLQNSVRNRQVSHEYHEAQPSNSAQGVTATHEKGGNSLSSSITENPHDKNLTSNLTKKQMKRSKWQFKCLRNPFDLQLIVEVSFTSQDIFDMSQINGWDPQKLYHFHFQPLHWLADVLGRHITPHHQLLDLLACEQMLNFLPGSVIYHRNQLLKHSVSPQYLPYYLPLHGGKTDHPFCVSYLLRITICSFSSQIRGFPCHHQVQKQMLTVVRLFMAYWQSSHLFDLIISAICQESFPSRATSEQARALSSPCSTSPPSRNQWTNGPTCPAATSSRTTTWIPNDGPSPSNSTHCTRDTSSGTSRPNCTPIPSCSQKDRPQPIDMSLGNSCIGRAIWRRQSTTSTANYAPKLWGKHR